MGMLIHHSKLLFPQAIPDLWAVGDSKLLEFHRYWMTTTLLYGG
jgi:hypothetical protein